MLSRTAGLVMLLLFAACSPFGRAGDEIGSEDVRPAATESPISASEPAGVAPTVPDAPRSNDDALLGVGASRACAVYGDGHLRCWGTVPAEDSGPPSGPYRFLAPAVGSGQACALRVDGRIACWGSSGDAPEGTFRRIGAGQSDDMCAIDEAGEITCWGATRALEQYAPPGPFIDVAVGQSEACAIREDHQVECWGKLETIADPVGEFAQFSTGNGGRCGVRPDGQLSCASLFAALTIPTTGDFTWVGSGGAFICALERAGTIACWGPSSNDVVTKRPTERFRNLATGPSAVCGVREDGKIVCWGDDALRSPEW